MKDQPDAAHSVSIDSANRTSTNTAVAYNYDDNGYLLADGTYQYVWNARNQSVEVRHSGTSLVTYAYDPLGRHSTKQLAGSAPISFVMDGKNVVGEATSSNYKQFVNGDGVDDWLSVYDSAGARHFVRDDLSRMKNPVAFTISMVIVLACTGLIFYFYGLPMLDDTSVGCRYGGGLRSFGCSTSFGTFITYLGAAVAVAVGAVWSRFGPY